MQRLQIATPFVLAALVLIASAPASAETLKPTRFDDPDPGQCKAKDCSFREAVIAANADVDKDTIKLTKGKYLIERPGAGPDPDADGDFNITERTQVEGKGARPRSTRKGIPACSNSPGRKFRSTG